MIISGFGISKLMTIEEPTISRGAGSQKDIELESINVKNKNDEKVEVYSFVIVVSFGLSDGKLPKIRMFDILKCRKLKFFLLSLNSQRN